MSRNIPIRYSVTGEHEVLQATQQFSRANERMFRDFATGGTRAAGTMHRVQGELVLANTELQRMAQRTEAAFRFVVAGFVARGARELVGYADAYKALNGQIATVTSTEEEATRVRERLFAIARETRSTIEATGTVYGRLSRSVRDLNISEEKRLKVTELANKAAKIGQTTTQEQTAALIQLSQGLGAGALQGEELKSVLENTPVLAQALADGLGVTTAKLREMGADGELTAEKVVNALLKMEDSINERFALVPVKVSEGFDALTTEVIRYVGEVDEARGLSDGFGGSLGLLADNIELVGTSLGALAIVGAGAAFGRMSTAAATSTKTFITNTKATRENAQAQVARAAATLKAAQFDQRAAFITAQRTKKYREIRDQTLRVAAAQANYNAALTNYTRVSSLARQVGAGFMNMVGGVPGLLTMAALSAIAFSDSLFDGLEPLSTTTTALDDYLTQIGKTAEGLETLTSKQREFALVQARADEAGAGNRLGQIAGALDDAADPFQTRLQVARRGRGRGASGFRGINRVLAQDLLDEMGVLIEAAEKGEMAAEDLSAAFQELESRTPALEGLVAALAEALGDYAEAAEVAREASDKVGKLAGLDAAPDFAAQRAAFLRDLGVDPEHDDPRPELDALLAVAEREQAITAELEKQIALLEMRASGRGDEATLMEEMAALEDRLGDTFELQRGHVEQLLKTRRALTDEIKLQAQVEKQTQALEKRLRLAKQQQQVDAARVEGNEELARALERQFALMEEFPDLAREQLAELEKILIVNQRNTDQLESQRRIQQQQRELSNFLFDAWTREGANFWDIFHDTGKRTLTDLLAVWATEGDIYTVFNPEHSQLGRLLGGVDGEGGLLRALGLAEDSIGGLTESLNNIFGGASLGFGLGQLFGAGGTAAAVGGGLGSAIGTLVGGPVGSLVGGAIGGIASAIFGGGSVDKAGTTVRVGSDGRIDQTRNRTRGDGDISVAQELAGALTSSLASIAEQLGGGLLPGFTLGELGFRKDEFFFDPTANATDKALGRPSKDPDTVRFQSGEAAVEAALVNALRGGVLTGLPEEVNARLRTVTAATLEEVLGDIQIYMSLSDAIETGLDGIIDPLAAGLDQIRAEYERAIEAYEGFGADVARVNEFYLQEQEAFIEAYKAQGTALLSDFLSELQSGQFAGLTPAERLAEAEAAFGDLAASVAAGADVDDQSLIEAGQALLEASLAVNAFTDAFFEDRSLVEDTIAQEIENFNATVADVLSTADLIQPLDTLADIGNETNTILTDMNEVLDGIRDLLSGPAGGGTGGGASGGPGYTRGAHFQMSF